MAPIPAAASKIIDLHNELDKHEPGDTRIGQIVWQLEALRRAHKYDFPVAVTLADAYARVGRREEALSEISNAYQMRNLGEQGMPDLSRVLLGLGDLIRAREVAAEFMAEPGLRVLPASLAQAWNIAFFDGDFARMRELSTLLAEIPHPEEDCRESALTVINLTDAIEREGMGPHLGAYSAIYWDIFKPSSLTIRMAVQQEVEINQTIGVIYSWTADDFETLIANEIRLENALDQYFKQKGVPRLDRAAIVHVATPVHIIDEARKSVA